MEPFVCIQWLGWELDGVASDLAGKGYLVEYSSEKSKNVNGPGGLISVPFKRKFPSFPQADALVEFIDEEYSTLEVIPAHTGAIRAVLYAVHDEIALSGYLLHKCAGLGVFIEIRSDSNDDDLTYEFEYNEPKGYFSNAFLLVRSWDEVASEVVRNAYHQFKAHGLNVRDLRERDEAGNMEYKLKPPPLVPSLTTTLDLLTEFIAGNGSKLYELNMRNALGISLIITVPSGSKAGKLLLPPHFLGLCAGLDLEVKVYSNHQENPPIS